MAKVKVYSTPTCPYCTMAKDYLKKKGVEFEDINVAADRKAAQEMIKRSGQMGVPQLLIGDTLVVGFDKEEIEKAIASLEEKK